MFAHCAAEKHFLPVGLDFKLPIKLSQSFVGPRRQLHDIPRQRVNELVINDVRRLDIRAKRNEISIGAGLKESGDVRRLTLVERFEGAERPIILKDDNRDRKWRFLVYRGE